jgi:ribosomal protein S20
MENKYREKIEQKDAVAAQSLLSELTSLFDKAAKTGTIPKKRCNRKKSRLTLLYNKTNKN